MNAAQLGHYRWEFLRRNERYQKDYKGLEKKLGEAPEVFNQRYHRVWMALYMQPADHVARDFPGVDLAQIKDGFYEIGRFREKWGVAKIQPHEINASPEFLREPATQAAMVEVMMPDSAATVQQADPDYLVLRLHLDAPVSEVLKRVEDLLLVQQNIRAQENMGDLRHPKIAALDLSLRLYDHIHVHGKSLEDAALLVFPESEPQKRLEQARALYEQAKHNVEMGFLND